LAVGPLLFHDISHFATVRDALIFDIFNLSFSQLNSHNPLHAGFGEAHISPSDSTVPNPPPSHATEFLVRSLSFFK